MFKFKLEYTDSSIKERFFDTKEEGIMWCHNEGDHLWNFTYEQIGKTTPPKESGEEGNPYSVGSR